MGSLTFDTGQVSITQTATSIVPASQQRTGVLITNAGTVDVYIGNSSVTTTTGALIPGIKGSSVAIPTRDAVYGIVAVTSPPVPQTVTYVETYI